jgi:hypothetical protein
MALSDWRPEYSDNWMVDFIPVVEPRRRSRLLTPYGWFVVLSVISLLLGAVLAFLT